MENHKYKPDAQASSVVPLRRFPSARSQRVPKQSRRKISGQDEIGVASSRDRPVLDVSALGDAEHLRPVVVAIGDVRGRPRKP